MDVKELIQKKETTTLELKPSLSQTDEIIETVSAFSNTRGGTIAIGVTNNGRIIGVDVGGDSVERLSNKIMQNTDPRVHPEISVEEIDEKKIILVKVKESTDKLVLTSGRPFKRVGSSTVKMSKEEYERMILEKHKDKLQFDTQICKEATLKDIDKEKVEWFVKEARRQRGLKLSEGLSTEKVLMILKLVKNKKLVNSALLLFSKEPWFLQSEIKCIRFSGNEPVKPYIDFESIDRNVFNLVGDAMNFIMKNIKKAIWVPPGRIQREEKYEYPLEAVREAIVNAVAHRDYETTSKIQVRIFDNRIEIWSPGLLPEGITLEDLKTEHRSIPRNPLLFKQLFWVKYVEDVGGGTLDMINLCKEWGILEPEFKHISGAFVVIFRLPPSIKDLERFGLNERQKKAIWYIGEKGAITNREYIILNNVSRKTATTDLTELVKKGLVVRIGAGKRNIRYELLRNNTQNLRKKLRK